MIEEPRRAGASSEGHPFLRLGFRPFYLGAAVFGALAVALWAARFLGLAVGGAQLDLLWHMHEMVFGMTVAVVVGFLFTAGRNWTNLWTPRGPLLAALFALWLAGRLGLALFPGPLAVALDLAFLPAAALPLYRVMQRSANLRNRFLPLLLMLLASLNLAYHAASAGWLALSPLRVAQAAVLVVVMIASVIGTRVIPMFTRNGAPGSAPVAHARRDAISQGLLVAAALAWLASAPAWLGAPLALAACGLLLWRVWQWQPQRVLGVPLLWILHLSYAWIGVGYGLLAAAWLELAPQSAAIHALAVGALGGLIIGMVTRTALGHTGRPLQARGLEVLMYGALQAGALLRVLAAFCSGETAQLLVGLAALGWVLAFATYAWQYGPYLWAARVDGREG
ncbi:NnrS family protein [Massilia sp. TS11]|uniref:NnrS family protein n=1 Tax=Massilia sp. TS11 TaxID=2908003 RepID=UPI001ED9DB02|nr:NnrS family protein [Massilia sp. TS11]MCG2585953.1 NnrS family protein [Massilia sp. TS11]